METNIQPKMGHVLSFIHVKDIAVGHLASIKLLKDKKFLK